MKSLDMKFLVGNNFPYNANSIACWILASADAVEKFRTIRVFGTVCMCIFFFLLRNLTILSLSPVLKFKNVGFQCGSIFISCTENFVFQYGNTLWKHVFSLECLLFGVEPLEIESVGHSVVSNSLCPIDCSPPGSSVHGILQVRILEWVAVSFSRASSLFICLLCLLRFPQLHLTTLLVWIHSYIHFQICIHLAVSGLNSSTWDLHCIIQHLSLQCTDPSYDAWAQ